MVTLIVAINNLWLKDPPIYDSNACVCSHHFTEQDFVSCVVEGFEPKRPMLKPDAILTMFCFSNPTKCRKLSKAREARTLHCSIIDNLLADPSTSSEPLSSKEPSPATRDIRIQCG